MKSAFARKSARNLLAAVLLLPVVAGCAQLGPGAEGKEAIDPPPADVEQTMLQAGQAREAMAQAGNQGGQAASDGLKKDELTVYLKDRNGYLAPMTLRTSAPSGEAQEHPELAALAWMTQDGKLADQLPAGFSPVLPEGTAVESAAVDPSTGTVTVDFASPFPKVPAKEERKMVEAIVWTMTELPGVRSVVVEAGGEPLRELPSSGLPLPGKLTRDFGINLEQAPGTNASRSMAVTLYFSARSAEGEGYFVPVTRLIERTNDRNRAALEELIKGPLDERELEPVFAPGVSVGKLSTSADTVSVDLTDPSWEPEMTVPGETMEALVLTMTEATGESKARITLNGESGFKDTDDRSYAQAVERPLAINALSR